MDMDRSILEIGSTTTYHECFEIWELASCLPQNSILVEIGTGVGRVTAVLASAVAGKGSIVHTIDDYSNPEKYGIYGDWSNKKAQENLSKLNLSGHVRFVIGNSVEIAKGFSDPIDMIFIDGDHLYSGICADIDAWYPLIKKGGIISGHDFDPNCSDGRNVIKAIFDKLLGNPDRPMTVRERVWWMEK